MSLRIRTFSMALVAMSAASQVYALPSDDSENKEKKEERNVMLNASDANKPREIQIGLPSEDEPYMRTVFLPFTLLPYTNSLPIGVAMPH